MAEKSEILIEGRRSVTVTGVDAILSFSDREAVFSTCLGRLAISGSSLCVDDLDKETSTVVVKGSINAAFYPGNKVEKQGFFNRLFGIRR